jgi:hypothetical protein
MDPGGKAEATNPQQSLEMPLTVAAIPQQNLKQNNMIDGSGDSTSQCLKGSRLTLVFPKADNDNINNLSNKKYDKIQDKNEENRRLLSTGGVPQSKFLIVPSVRQEAVVSIKGVKQNAEVPSTGHKDSVSASSPPASNCSISGTGDSKLQNKNATGNRELRPLKLMAGLELPGLEESIRAGHTLPLTVSSLRSLKLEDSKGRQTVVTPPGAAWRSSFCFSEATSHVSVRSLASVGMGSTDGRKVTIRRVPTSPTELFNIVHSPT